MWFSRYIILFVIVSFLGWAYETLFALIRRRRWENRGFLYSPICPIYGVGALILIGVCRLMTGSDPAAMAWWQVFLISCVGSAVLEYVTSWGLEKLFHARWWDYSNLPLNIQGRICLPAALAFGVAGLLLAYVIIPLISQMIDGLSPTGVDVLGVILIVWLVIDLTMTVLMLTKFGKKMRQLEEKINRHMEVFVKNAKDSKRLATEAIARERERFTMKAMRQMLQNGNLRLRRTLYRIKLYKYPKIESKTIEQVIDDVKRFWRQK